MTGPTPPIGEPHGAARLSEIRERVRCGRYGVDERAVAEAILRRFLDGILPAAPVGGRLAPADGGSPAAERAAQEECS